MIYFSEQKPEQPSERRGITPFKGGISKEEGKEGVIKSPKIPVGPLGTLHVELTKPDVKHYSPEDEAFTVNSKGEEVMGSFGEMLKRGYRDVMIVIEPPPHRQELENFREELFNEDRKINCNLWIDGTNFSLTNEVNSGGGLLFVEFAQFYLDKKNINRTRLFLLPVDESLLKRVNINFELPPKEE